jgi:hypothetical protein
MSNDRGSSTYVDGRYILITHGRQLFRKVSQSIIEFFPAPTSHSLCHTFSSFSWANIFYAQVISAGGLDIRGLLNPSFVYCLSSSKLKTGCVSEFANSPFLLAQIALLIRLKMAWIQFYIYHKKPN